VSRDPSEIILLWCSIINTSYYQCWNC